MPRYSPSSYTLNTTYLHTHLRLLVGRQWLSFFCSVAPLEQALQKSSYPQPFLSCTGRQHLEENGNIISLCQGVHLLYMYLLMKKNVLVQQSLSNKATLFAKKLWPHQRGGLWREGEVNASIVAAPKICGPHQRGGPLLRVATKRGTTVPILLETSGSVAQNVHLLGLLEEPGTLPGHYQGSMEHYQDITKAAHKFTRVIQSFDVVTKASTMYLYQGNTKCCH